MFFRKQVDLEQAMLEIKNIKDTAEDKDTLQDIKDRYIQTRDACIKALTLYIKWPQFPKHQQQAIDFINDLRGIADNEEISKKVRAAEGLLVSDYTGFRGEEYHTISMVADKPSSRADVKAGTIVLLKGAKKLTAYWIEHGSMRQRALAIKDVQTIMARLPAVNGNSNNTDLIVDVTYKYGCGFDGNKPPGRYFQIVTATSNKIARLSPLHYEKNKAEKNEMKNRSPR